MAFLKYLEIEAQEKRIARGPVPFRTTCYHVKEIFMQFLPKKLLLDGSSKFLVLLSADDGSHTSTVLGVTQCVIGNFDFPRYFSLGATARAHMILDLVEDVLTQNCNGDLEVSAQIRQACEQVRAAQFVHEYELVKLKKKYKPLDATIHVHRRFSSEVGEAWRAVVSRGGKSIHEWSISDSTYVDGQACLKNAAIEGDSYVVRDSTGNVMFTASLAEIA